MWLVFQAWLEAQLGAEQRCQSQLGVGGRVGGGGKGELSTFDRHELVDEWR